MGGSGTLDLSTVKLDGLEYTLDNKGHTATLKECTDKDMQTVTVPEFVNKDGEIYKVISIGESAFYGCSRLGSIELPDSLTSLGEYAFEWCSRLTQVIIPANVTSIGKHAFFGCSSLNSIELPDSLTSLGEYAFSSCICLNSIELPDSLTSIGEYAFYGCGSLSSIELPDSLTNIGKYAFHACISLSSIKLPDSLTSVGEGAFSGCNSLTQVIIPANVTSIGDFAFESCKNLKQVEILNSNIDMGQGAFGCCDTLELFKIPYNANYETKLYDMAPRAEIVYLDQNSEESSSSLQSSNGGSKGFVFDSSTQESARMNKQSDLEDQDKGLLFDSELMLGEDGSSKSLIANLYKKITANDVGSSKISEWFKNSTQKVISKLENILQVKENTSNSLVILNRRK